MSKEKKKKVKVVKVMEMPETVKCKDCKWYVEGLCVRKGRVATIACEFWEEGSISDKELAELHLLLKERLKDLEEHFGIVREAMIKRFGTGKHIAGNYIVTVKRYERSITDMEKIKELIKGREEEFIKEKKEVYYVKVDPIVAKRI